MEKSVFEKLLEFYLSKDKTISVDKFCSDLNDENLYCNTFYVNAINKATKATEIKFVECVCIKDDKYGINGVYLVDQEEDDNTITHFLMPIQDLNKYMDTFIDLDTAIPSCCHYALVTETPKNKKFYNPYAQILLKHQKLLNETEEREKFKNKMMEVASEKSEEEVAKMAEKLSGENEFASTQLEYAFLKHEITKLNDKSQAITLSQYRNAITEICISRGMKPCDAIKVANKVIKDSKAKAFKSFSSSAKNEFSVNARKNFNRKQSLIDEIINHKTDKEKTKE